jgi:2-methylcitrate dehydratase PrpD
VSGGIKAAFLAKMGVTGARNSIEGEKGFFHVYHGDDYSHDALVGELGERWESANISIKPYPACRGTHPAIDAALSLRRDRADRLPDIEGVVISVGKGTLGLLCEPFEAKTKPRNPVDAQFSVPWGVAVSLAKGRPGLLDYTDEAIKNPDFLAMTAKISVQNEPRFDGSGLEPAEVTIKLKNGETFTALTELATGSPGNMLGYGDVVSKFSDCVKLNEKNISAASADGIVQFVRGIDGEKDIREIFKYLVWE